MTEETEDPIDRGLEASFMALLVEDVIAAKERLARHDSQGGRRDVVRSTFAAIEGDIWMLREHVRDIATARKEITPLADMALRERTYSVTPEGDIIEQIRFVTLRAMIRLVIKQAKLVAPQLDVDLTNPGWDHLKQAISIRNNVTHPKSKADLVIGDHDLTIVSSAFVWTLTTTENIMKAVGQAHRRYVGDMRWLLDELAAGNPLALQAYQHALEQVRDEN